MHRSGRDAEVSSGGMEVNVCGVRWIFMCLILDYLPTRSRIDGGLISYGVEMKALTGVTLVDRLGGEEKSFRHFLLFRI